MASYDDTATVSGSVVSISDGADEVGVKSCVVTVRPTLTGTSEVVEKQTGKNLLDTAIAETKTHNSVSITCDGNVKYTATGTATGGSANITFTLKTPCTIKSGMYLHLMNSGANASVSITLQKQDNTTIYAPALSPANRIADLSSYVGETIYSIRFYVANGASFEMELTPMICVSGTATTYTPYVAPTTYTANLPATNYGGSVDFVNGDVVGGYARIKISDLTWTKQTSGNINYFISDVSGMDATNSKDIVCDVLPYCGAVSVSLMPDKSIAQYSWNNRTTVRIRDEELSDETALINTYGNGYIAYPLATPTDFTFPGQTIETKLGANTFWSEQGDTELTYYKSGYGFTSVTVNKVGKNLIRAPIFTPSTPTLCFDAGRDITVSNITMSFLATNAVVQATNAAIVDYRKEDGTRTYRTLNWFRDANNNQFTANTPQNGKFKNSDSNITFRYIYIYYESISYSRFESDCISEWQIELASTASDYTPYEAVSKTAKFHRIVYEGEVDAVRGTGKVSIGESGTEYDPPETFTFPPISIETDEGENTLFANEGDSAITYRKAVD